MKMKLLIVSKEDEQDLKNLGSRLQQHATLEAEVVANFPQVTEVLDKARDHAENSSHYHDELHRQAQELEELWQQLAGAVEQQKKRLEEAHTELQVIKKIEEANSWIAKMESQMECKILSFDVTTILEEKDKIKQIELETNEWKEKLQMLQEFSGNPAISLSSETSADIENTFSRFLFLEQSLVRIQNDLEEEHILAMLENDISDELSWIEECAALCLSEEFADDIISLQVLQKKLKTLEVEMNSRETFIDDVVKRGKCQSTTQSKVEHLIQRYQEVKDAINLKSSHLSEALEAQQFYFEVAQAELWIKGKLAQVLRCQEDPQIETVQGNLKRVSGIGSAVEAFKQTMTALHEAADNLELKKHSEKKQIHSKLTAVQQLFQQLSESIENATMTLDERAKILKFQREIQREISQLRSFYGSLNSEEVGRDSEHTEVLLQTHTLIGSQLSSHKNSVETILQQAFDLIQENRAEKTNINELSVELEKTWSKCNAMYSSRLKILEGAKLIQAFSKSTTETIRWIQEKDAAFSSEDYGQDLENVEILQRHHQSIEGALMAIREQVQALEQEADELSEKLPESQEIFYFNFQSVKSAWENCQQKAAIKKEKLAESRAYFAYIEETRDFQNWIQEMSGLISRQELPETIQECEALIAHHECYRSEIEAQGQALKAITDPQTHTLAKKSFGRSDSVRAKMKDLRKAFDEMKDLWEERKDIYAHHLQLLIYRKQVEELNNWLQEHERCLTLEEGRSIEQVENQLRDHLHFEEKLSLCDTKFKDVVENSKIQEFQRSTNEINERKREQVNNEERSGKNSISDEIDQSHGEVSYSPAKHTKQSLKQKKRMSIFAKMRTKSRSESITESIMEDYLDRKQELQVGGKKATSRSWKNYYTVLSRHSLHFFKDKNSFLNKKEPAKATINILDAQCYQPIDYIKKKFVFRLEQVDGSSFLFQAASEIKRNEWITKITNASENIHEDGYNGTLEDSNDLYRDKYNDRDRTNSQYREMDNSATMYENICSRQSSVSSYKTG